jgi:hypothetical protein
MNPELIHRVRKGGFVQVTFEHNGEDFTMAGWCGSNPDDAERKKEEFCPLRLDTWLRDDDDHLVQASLHLEAGELKAVHFLSEAPEFVDKDGASVRMEEGFFPNL